MANQDEAWRSWVQALVEGVPEVVEEFWRLYGGPAPRAGCPSRQCRAGAPRGAGGHRAVGLPHLLPPRSGPASSDSKRKRPCGASCVRSPSPRSARRSASTAARSGEFDRERPLGPGDDGGPADVRPSGAAAPDPADAAEFADELQRLLAHLDDEQRAVVELKLQEYTNEEAAQRMRCSERTVRRILKGVKIRWKRVLEESEHE